jgi:hypothetical protein
MIYFPSSFGLIFFFCTAAERMAHKDHRIGSLSDPFLIDNPTALDNADNEASTMPSSE